MREDHPAAYVVGQWVRGPGFYGRGDQIQEILDGPRDCLWVLGTRRIGKTSLLKHLEFLTASSPERGYLPLYWDLQGADSQAELHLGFRDSVLDAEERFERNGIRLAEIETDDLFDALGRLRQNLRSRQLKLLLLCDETEELIRIGREDPGLLDKLRRTLRAGGRLRTVLASTIRLWSLNERRGDTTPLLQSFSPPLYLPPLLDEEARSLVRQTQLPAISRPMIDEQTAERIRAACGNHPYLLQYLGKRALELGDEAEALRQLATDDSVASLFWSDFETLPDADRSVLRALSETDGAGRDRRLARLPFSESTLSGIVHSLDSLGIVVRDDRGVLELKNALFARWLRSRSGDSTAADPGRARPANAPRADEIVADLSRIDGPRKWSPDDLFEQAYQPLRDLAGRYLRRERPGHTLQPTALVHEAYLKLIDQSRVDWKGRSHFFAVGARIMRRILIDHAKTKRRAKRGGDRLRVTLNGLPAAPAGGGELDAAELLELHSALERLAEISPRQARVVELRFFGGLGMAEIAAALWVSKRTADGDWAKARAWLEKELAGWGDGSSNRQ